MLLSLSLRCVTIHYGLWLQYRVSIYGCTYTQPTDARRALPCWDEPAHKATFDVTLVVPKDKVALSNMVSNNMTTLSHYQYDDPDEMVWVCRM